MKRNQNSNNINTNQKNSKFIPNSLKFISSCIKTASSGVRSAGASVAASISGDTRENKDQVLWSSFDRLELSPSSFRHVLLLGYSNGFQVLDVEEASNVSELVSRRDDPVTFLQMQPLPAKSDHQEGFRNSHPLLLVVACDKSKTGLLGTGRDGLVRDCYDEPQAGNPAIAPTAVRFYSLRSHNYVHVLRFRSPIYMVRCSSRIVAVGLATQIYCFDALTLENKFSVLTYPVPQLGGQGVFEVNVGYGPMAVGPRWLAYASNNPLLPNTGRLSPQSLTPPCVSPSTSPGNGSLVARYAVESSKQLAAGLINLGDMGYKTLSRYYQDFIPDGSSSPVSSNSSWKVVRGASHSTETDIAGMVVVKDFVSRAVISQFRAHTSPISALCFDPSGTLLVTASIHGNNINIFRILPSSSKHRVGTSSGTQNYDWSSSHVHLYKLHRGMTSAVIQDICFSQYSQWVAIVSSRGTCHIFVLAPFGGETVLKIQNSHVDGPTLSPVLSQPWWSSPSFMTSQQSLSSAPPPSPVTLSVVSRIKNNSSGWFNTVSNAASSATGKAYIPSGALAAVFHCSVPQDLQAVHLKVNALEHLLVYSPSGNVVQYKLLSSTGGETREATLRTGPGYSTQVQDEELGVQVEPVQGWDVCRRTDWLEREECIYGITLVPHDTSEMIMDTSDCEDNDIRHKEFVKLHDRSHLHISNAEVQMSSGQILVWQNSKIHFYTMSPLETGELNSIQEHANGEIEIEKVPVHYVEIRRKDLLPVFENFHRIQPDWSGRGISGGRSSVSYSESNETKEKFFEEADITQSKSSSPGSIGGSSKITYPSINWNESFGTRRGTFDSETSALNQILLNKEAGSTSLNKSAVNVCPLEDRKFSNTVLSRKFSNTVLSLTNGSLSAGGAVVKEFRPSTSGGTGRSNISSNNSNLSTNTMDEGSVNNSLDFEYFFQESCKASTSSDCHESTGVVTDVDSSKSHCNKEKSEEDGDNDKSEKDCDDDDMLGGVFAFSEEG